MSERKTKKIESIVLGATLMHVQSAYVLKESGL